MLLVGVREISANEVTIGGCTRNAADYRSYDVKPPLVSARAGKRDLTEADHIREQPRAEVSHWIHRVHRERAAYPDNRGYRQPDEDRAESGLWKARVIRLRQREDHQQQKHRQHDFDEERAARAHRRHRARVYAYAARVGIEAREDHHQLLASLRADFNAELLKSARPVAGPQRVNASGSDERAGNLT